MTTNLLCFQGEYENANVMPTTVVGGAAFNGVVDGTSRYVVPPVLV